MSDAPEHLDRARAHHGVDAAEFDAGQPVYCVWTGRKLGQEGMDIDQCLPFSAWPNADLWNLMPTDARVNRHRKADRLVSANLLDRCGDRITDWWERAYLRGGDVLARRFGREAAASLPVERYLMAWSALDRSCRRWPPSG